MNMDSHDIVLVVDDVPDNLSVLHDALDDAGYTVLVATHGEQALQRAQQAQPDIILLDALMPGMDGFEVARRLKADAQTAAIPVVFMTGLTETEHLVAALAAGGVDYVTKPIKPVEVLARMQVHLGTARKARKQAQQALQARSALDAFGYASMTVRVDDGRILWQTALARRWMQAYGHDRHSTHVDEAVRAWMALRMDSVLQGGLTEPPRWVLQPPQAQTDSDNRLVLHLHPPQEGQDGELLVVMREESGSHAAAVLREAFALTAKESEVLFWVAQGKINRDIADIVGSSPATVKKHLERIHTKLGVETRTAAAAMALGKLKALPATA